MSNVTISAAEVNKLRQQTGAGMMDCRKALIESEGDFEKAIDYLRKKGQKVAANRSDREAKEGVVMAKSNAENNYGIILNLSAETDFVSKNQEFIDFAQKLTDLALNAGVKDIESLKSLEMEGATVEEKLLEVVAKIGEKIDIVHFEHMAAETVVPYIHAGYRIGVLVGLNQKGEDKITEAGKDIAMQIAAMNPLAVDASKIDPSVIEREKAIAMEQIQAEGKTGDIVERIAQGKINAFFKENTLLQQAFVKDNKKSVEAYLKSVSEGLTVVDFKRVAVG